MPMHLFRLTTSWTPHWQDQLIQTKNEMLS